MAKETAMYRFEYRVVGLEWHGSSHLFAYDEARIKADYRAHRDLYKSGHRRLIKKVTKETVMMFVEDVIIKEAN